jgi:hypothetical protein
MLSVSLLLGAFTFLASFASCDSAIHIVDCIQHGQAHRTLLTYHANDNAVQQPFPDATHPLPSSYADEVTTFSTDIGSFAGFTTSSISLNLPNAAVGAISGGAALGGKRYTCYRDAGRVLYQDRTFASSPSSPFAQCLARHYCTPVPPGGSVELHFQYAVECQGKCYQSCWHQFSMPDQSILMPPPKLY